MAEGGENTAEMEEVHAEGEINLDDLVIKTSEMDRKIEDYTEILDPETGNIVVNFNTESDESMIEGDFSRIYSESKLRISRCNSRTLTPIREVIEPTASPTGSEKNETKKLTKAKKRRMRKNKKNLNKKAILAGMDKNGGLAESKSEGSDSVPHEEDGYAATSEGTDENESPRIGELCCREDPNSTFTVEETKLEFNPEPEESKDIKDPNYQDGFGREGAFVSLESPTIRSFGKANVNIIPPASLEDLLQEGPVDSWYCGGPQQKVVSCDKIIESASKSSVAEKVTYFEKACVTVVSDVKESSSSTLQLTAVRPKKSMDAIIQMEPEMEPLKMETNAKNFEISQQEQATQEIEEKPLENLSDKINKFRGSHSELSLDVNAFKEDAVDPGKQEPVSISVVASEDGLGTLAEFPSSAQTNSGPSSHNLTVPNPSLDNLYSKVDVKEDGRRGEVLEVAPCDSENMTTLLKTNQEYQVKLVNELTEKLENEFDGACQKKDERTLEDIYCNNYIDYSNTKETEGTKEIETAVNHEPTLENGEKCLQEVCEAMEQTTSSEFLKLEIGDMARSSNQSLNIIGEGKSLSIDQIARPNSHFELNEETDRSITEHPSPDISPCVSALSTVSSIHVWPCASTPSLAKSIDRDSGKPDDDGVIDVLESNVVDKMEAIKLQDSDIQESQTSVVDPDGLSIAKKPKQKLQQLTDSEESGDKLEEKDSKKKSFKRWLSNPSSKTSTHIAINDALTIDDENNINMAPKSRTQALPPEGGGRGKKRGWLPKFLTQCLRRKTKSDPTLAQSEGTVEMDIFEQPRRID